MQTPYWFIAAFLLTYFLFPSFYRSLSHTLFLSWYRYHAPMSYSVEGDQYVYSGIEEMEPLYVLARPPQTPYDVVITTVPSGEEAVIDRNIHTGRVYVYNGKGVPLGRVYGKYGGTYLVTLFSSPSSKERFSVNGHLAEGTGIGGGGFSVQTPLDKQVTIGSLITHQLTGRTVGKVLAVEPLPEKNVQLLRSAIADNPVQTAVLFVRKEAEQTVSDEDIEVLINSVNERARREETEKEETL